MRGVYVSYVIVAWTYFGVAFAGYWAFGNLVEDNVLFSLSDPKGVIAMASIFVLVHVLGSYVRPPSWYSVTFRSLQS